MEKQNNKLEVINKNKAKKLACIICLSFLTACSIIVIILVFVFCKK